MGVPTNKPTKEQELLAEKLAQKQMREIQVNRNYTDFLNRKYLDLERKGIVSCHYNKHIDDFVPHHRFIEFLAKLLDDVKTGKIKLPED